MMNPEYLSLDYTSIIISVKFLLCLYNCQFKLIKSAVKITQYYRSSCLYFIILCILRLQISKSKKFIYVQIIESLEVILELYCGYFLLDGQFTTLNLGCQEMFPAPADPVVRWWRVCPPVIKLIIKKLFVN